MNNSSANHPTEFSGRAGFATTHWSVVLAAGQSSSPSAAQALATLCQNYWYPLYAYLRRQGHSPHDAQDLTQAFFESVLTRQSFRHARQERGRFRTFLLVALKHFLSDEWDKARAQKRGGGRSPFSLDELNAESRYAAEPANTASPEVLFERRWAMTLLEQALSRVEAEYDREGKTPLYQALRNVLLGEQGDQSYAEVGLGLRMSEGAVKVAVHRLRRRFRETLRQVVGETVEHPEDIDLEIRQMAQALSG